MLDQFRQLYGSTEGIRIFRAPGRVNLIGEHTDYNLGFVLPIALELATFVATAPSTDGKLRIYSEHKKEMYECRAAEVAGLEQSRNWTDYPIGVALELVHAGFPIEPANFLIRSTVPEGSGLSSSAALEVSSALAFLRGRPLEKLELAQLCQRAERNFAGMPCGIMDQYISLFGHAQSAIELDCRSLEHHLVPLPGGIAFVAVNTMVKHALASSAYEERVRECAEAVEHIRLIHPHVKSLRDVTDQQFESLVDSLPPAIARRARHVITETARVKRFAEACERGDYTAMGRLLVESHRSLQSDYVVSSPELDFLVEAALRMEGVYGARMTGAGFGGCVIAMLRNDSLDRFTNEIKPHYEKRFGIIPEVYLCRPSDGATEVKNFERIPGVV